MFERTDQITDHLDVLQVLAAEEGLQALSEGLALCRRLYDLECDAKEVASRQEDARRANHDAAHSVGREQLFAFHSGRALSATNHDGANPDAA